MDSEIFNPYDKNQVPVLKSHDDEPLFFHEDLLSAQPLSSPMITRDEARRLSIISTSQHEQSFNELLSSVDPSFCDLDFGQSPDDWDTSLQMSSSFTTLTPPLSDKSFNRRFSVPNLTRLQIGSPLTGGQQESPMMPKSAFPHGYHASPFPDFNLSLESPLFNSSTETISNFFSPSAQDSLSPSTQVSFDFNIQSPRTFKDMSATFNKSPLEKLSPGKRTKYICSASGCHESFDSSSAYRNHLKCHYEKSFQCNVCGYSFKRNHDLKRHSRLHTNERPFQCVKCKKGYTRSDALRRHERVDSCGRLSAEYLGQRNDQICVTPTNDFEFFGQAVRPPPNELGLEDAVSGLIFDFIAP